jgi:cytochrome c-type biogenesis protein CcmH
MLIFILGGSILAMVTLVLLAASLRAKSSFSSLAPSDIYKDQLAELERDKAFGKVSAQDAASLRTEIARRLLADDKRQTNHTDERTGKMLPILFALFVPLISIPAYLVNGAPAFPDTPLAQRLADAEKSGDTLAMIAKVEAHLASKPNDARGWELLAPIYMNLGRFSDAAGAYARIIQLSEPNAETFASFGEALFNANNGIVDAETNKAFQQALAINPTHVKSLYYSAVTLKQDGKTSEARALFESLLQAAPEDAPWRKLVERELAALAKPPALSEEQLQAGQSMSGTQQQEMIRDMVDGLEQRLTENGNDLEGWLRLIRARSVLGEADRALLSLTKARKIFANDDGKIASLEALAKEVGLQ